MVISALCSFLGLSRLVLAPNVMSEGLQYRFPGALPDAVWQILHMIVCVFFFVLVFGISGCKRYFCSGTRLTRCDAPTRLRNQISICNF